MKRNLALAKRDTAVGKRIARWQNKFIAALSETPSVKHASKVAGIHRNTAYKYRKLDAEFAAAWTEALDASVDDLEAKAFRFALSGPPKDNSGVNAWVNLVQFLLRSHRRSVYGEKLEAAVAGGLIILPAKREGPE
jgi:hypothetical protein